MNLNQCTELALINHVSLVSTDPVVSSCQQTLVLLIVGAITGQKRCSSKIYCLNSQAALQPWYLHRISVYAYHKAHIPLLQMALPK